MQLQPGILSNTNKIPQQTFNHIKKMQNEGADNDYGVHRDVLLVVRRQINVDFRQSDLRDDSDHPV